ncbi:hypothetical protein [Methanobrevibacter sp. DSM 116169]|uniref:hypothetical protein n=1 Tax=Methanobrevibacter sp. DSM 116169 TaxID=3242727 RepID=UPI0038FC7159
MTCNCAFCGSKKVEYEFAGDDEFAGVDFYNVKCLECGLIFKSWKNKKNPSKISQKILEKSILNDCNDFNEIRAVEITTEEGDTHINIFGIYNSLKNHDELYKQLKDSCTKHIKNIEFRIKISKNSN